MLQNLFISRKKRKTLIFCGKSRTKTRTSLLHIAEPQWSNNRLKSPCHAPFWCFILSPGCIRVKKPAVMHYGRDFRLKSDVCHLWGGAEGKVEISHTVHCCLSLTAEPFIPEDRVSAVGILLFTPLTIWRNKQCSRKGLLLSISGSSPHPSSPQFQLIYIYISWSPFFPAAHWASGVTALSWNSRVPYHISDQAECHRTPCEELNFFFFIFHFLLLLHLY